MNEIILDTETTGLSIKDDHRVVEIACIETQNLIPTKRIFYKLINPERDVSVEALKIHGYSNEVLKNIISSDKSLHSSILIVNLKKMEFRKIKFTKKKGCLCN